MSAEQRALIAEKRAAYAALDSKKNSDVDADLFAEPKVRDTPRSEDVEVTGDGASFPPSATMCHKSSAKAVVIMDGCATCLNFGYSKFGLGKSTPLVASVRPCSDRPEGEYL